jgi:hypothetical protein
MRYSVVVYVQDVNRVDLAATTGQQKQSSQMKRGRTNEREVRYSEAMFQRAIVSLLSHARLSAKLFVPSG